MEGLVDNLIFTIEFDSTFNSFTPPPILKEILYPFSRFIKIGFPN